MKILGIVGSPHMEIGNTYCLVDALLKEAERLGAETEIILLSDLKIDYCVGCATCLIDGECPQEDDVKELHGKMSMADGIVLGSPVYFLDVTAQMKTFIDRSFFLGHRPYPRGKYGASVAVYAGVGDVDRVANYMNMVLRGIGVATVGKLCAYATLPGELKEGSIKRAKELGRELVLAIQERREYPELDRRSMKNLIMRNKDLFKVDYKYWKEMGWIDGDL
jgi:multimeric flavodoxin WrbA